MNATHGSARRREVRGRRVADSLAASQHHLLRALACGLARDRRPRQRRRSRLDREVMVERVPGADAAVRRGLAGMENVVADQRPGDAELRVGLEVRVVARIDLRELRLETAL